MINEPVDELDLRVSIPLLQAKRLVEGDDRKSMAFRTLIRRSAGCRAYHSCLVEVVAGSSPPRLSGESGCFKTRGGTVITYPGAYSKSGWSNMVYSSSSLAVTVGAEWVLANLES